MLNLADTESGTIQIKFLIALTGLAAFKKKIQ